MNLAKYDGKYVCIRSIYGDTFLGRAAYENREFLECEYGGDEDGFFIEDFLIYRSQIKSIEETEVHGTAELWTEQLILRRVRPEDLYRRLGTDPETVWHSRRNSYATLETARETVRGLIDSYRDEHVYSWVMDYEDVLTGTIEAFAGKDDSVEVSFRVVRGWEGRGFATEALKKVLEYLTENEGIPCVTARCAAEDIGAQKVLEKAGMKRIGTEKDGSTVKYGLTKEGGELRVES